VLNDAPRWPVPLRQPFGEPPPRAEPIAMRCGLFQSQLGRRVTRPTPPCATDDPLQHRARHRPRAAPVEPESSRGDAVGSGPRPPLTSGPHRPVRWCAHGADDRSGSQERGPSWPQTRKSSKAPTPALRRATYRLPWLRWMSPSSGQRPMATCWRAPTSALKPCWKVCSRALGKSATSSRSCPTRSSLKVTQS
jgi:hypothetical protein